MFRHRENRRRRSLGDRLRSFWERTVALIRRVGPWVVLAAVAVAVASLVYYGYRRLLSSPYFRVSDITIRGERHADIQSLAERARLVHGVNIFGLDVSSAAETLETSPWVRSAHIDRRLPDGLTVTLEERRPGALLADGQLYVLDRGGRVVEGVDASDRGAFLDLPLLTGLSSDELDEESNREIVREAMRVAVLYEKLGLGERHSLSEIHVDPVLGLTLVTEGTATEVRLGRGQYRSRLERLKTVRRTLDARGIEPSYLLMHRDSLERVIVGPRRSQGSAGGGAD